MTVDRSAIMRAVKGRDTGPELAIRKIAHRLKPGYRLNRSDLPGKPDIAWIGARRAVFVHGCFWHGHDCPRGARVPKNNREYWIRKIARNRERDDENSRRLEKAGWRVLTIWECEMKDLAETEMRLRAFLGLPTERPSR